MSLNVHLMWAHPSVSFWFMARTFILRSLSPLHGYRHSPVCVCVCAYVCVCEYSYTYVFHCIIFLFKASLFGFHFCISFLLLIFLFSRTFFPRQSHNSALLIDLWRYLCHRSIFPIHMTQHINSVIFSFHLFTCPHFLCPHFYFLLK